MWAVFDKNYPYHLPLLLLMGVFFFFPFLGSVHLFDWDEINFAESAREMLVSGNYTQVQINFQPFWEKPPLFFWLQAASMKLFGVNEFAARFPNAVFGLLTLLVFYKIGKKHYDSLFGFIWALSYLGSFLPHLYFKSGIIDPVFNLFIFLGVYFLARTIHAYQVEKNNALAMYSGIFTGLAVLTKGPVGFLLVLLVFLVYWIGQGFRKISGFRQIVLFALMVFLVSFLWYGIELIQNGFWFFKEFINYQIELLTEPVAGHEQPFYYHFLVVFLGCFPMSVLALPQFKTSLPGFFLRVFYYFINLFSKGKLGENIRQIFEVRHFNLRKWMMITFWVVMILFSLVKTKIVHYSSMSYLPLSFLCALTVYPLITHENKLAKPIRYVFLIFGLLFSLLLTGLPLFAMNKELFYTYIDDPFAVASLQTPVLWGGWEWAIGMAYGIIIVMAFYLLNRKANAKSIALLFTSTALCLFLYTAVVVPKIEGYSQAPAIQFYKSLQGKDVYVSTVGFKSYAHYFYYKVPQREGHHNKANEQWLLQGAIDKPAYFVTKITLENKPDSYKGVKLLYTRGGFAFYVRYPQDHI